MRLRSLRLSSLLLGYIVLFLPVSNLLAETLLKLEDRGHLFEVIYYDAAYNIQLEGIKTEEVKLLPLANPARLVVDLPAQVRFKVANHSLQDKVIKAVRVGQHVDKLRVVVDLQGSAEPVYQLRNSEDRVQIVLGAMAQDAKSNAALNPTPLTTAAVVPAPVEKSLPAEVKSEPVAKTQPPVPVEVSAPVSVIPKAKIELPALVIDADDFVQNQNSPETVQVSKRALPKDVPVKPATQTIAAVPPPVNVGKAEVAVPKLLLPENIQAAPLVAASALTVVPQQPIKAEPLKKEALSPPAAVKVKPGQGKRDTVQAYTIKDGSLEVVPIERQAALSKMKKPATIQPTEPTQEIEVEPVPAEIQVQEAVIAKESQPAVTNGSPQLTQTYDPAKQIEAAFRHNKPEQENYLWQIMTCAFFALLLIVMSAWRNSKKYKLVPGYEIPSKQAPQTFSINESYNILGCDENDSNQTIKERYKQLVKTLHTDKLDNQEIPEEVRELLREQFQKVLTAYGVVKQERGIS